MSQIAVTPEEIRVVAGQVAAGATEIETQSRQLLTQVQQLGDTWQGVAASTMQQLFVRWHTEALKLNQTLTEISQAMQQAAANYETAEQMVTKSFQA